MDYWIILIIIIIIIKTRSEIESHMEPSAQ